MQTNITGNPATVALVADIYRQHMAAATWGCVAMMDAVVAVMAEHPSLRQPDAITAVIAIVRRIRQVI